MLNTSFVTTKGQVTIPIKVRKKLNLTKGSRVVFSEHEGKIILNKTPDFFEFKGSIKSVKRFSEEKIDNELRKTFKKSYE